VSVHKCAPLYSTCSINQTTLISPSVSSLCRYFDVILRKRSNNFYHLLQDDVFAVVL